MSAPRCRLSGDEHKGRAQWLFRHVQLGWVPACAECLRHLRAARDDVIPYDERKVYDRGA